jgi:hypothetical protein
MEPDAEDDEPAGPAATAADSNLPRGRGGELLNSPPATSTLAFPRCDLAWPRVTKRNQKGIVLTDLAARIATGCSHWLV